MPHARLALYLRLKHHREWTLYWHVAQPLSEQFEIVKAVHDDRRWDAYGRSTCFAEGKVMRWTEYRRLRGDEKSVKWVGFTMKLEY